MVRRQVAYCYISAGPDANILGFYFNTSQIHSTLFDCFYDGMGVGSACIMVFFRSIAVGFHSCVCLCYCLLAALVWRVHVFVRGGGCECRDVQGAATNLSLRFVLDWYSGNGRWVWDTVQLLYGYQRLTEGFLASLLSGLGN